MRVCLFVKEVIVLFRKPSAPHIAFALVTVEHHAAQISKDGVSEVEEAMTYARALGRCWR